MTSDVPKRGRGRPKGAVNTERREAKELAIQHGPEIIAELARLALKAKSEMARISAGEAVLNRAYGKPVQQIDANINARVAFEDMLVAASKYDEEQRRRAERGPDTE